MKYRITLNGEDYVRFRIFHLYHSKLGKRQIHSARTIAFKLSAIILLLLLIMDVQLDRIVIYAIMWAIVSVAFYFYAPKNIYNNAVQAAIIPYRCLGEDKKQVIKFVMENMKDKLRK